jgi:hypothetical protein
MAYTKYSLTPADNNAAPPNGAPEGMLPSAVNDTMRDMMSQIRDVGDGIRGGTYTMTAPVITGGSINGTTVGASTASTGAFTTLGASGVATFSAGSVSAPAITTTGDSNTGIFFPAADAIAFTEGGVEAMRINANGDVGIGTTTPGASLTVSRAGQVTTTLISTSSGSSEFVQQGATTNTARHVLSAGGQTAYASSFDISQDVGGVAVLLNRANSPMTFSTNGTERMRIAANGAVGIGVSPGVQLDVQGSSNQFRISTGAANSFYGFDAAAGSCTWKDFTDASEAISLVNTSNFINFTTNGTERMRIGGSGNVSIGTTLAVARLSVTNISTTDSTAIDLRGQRSFAATTYGATSIVAVSDGTRNSHDFGAIRFEQNPATSDGGGALARFFVAGNSSSFPTSAEFLRATSLNNSGPDNIQFRTQDVERVRIDGSGNLLIQTNSVYLRLKTGSTNFDISAQAGANDFVRISANGTQRFQLNDLGAAYNSTGTWGTISDARLKENIVDATSKLEKVNQLRVVNYNLKSDPNVKQIGFIAQEIEQVFPSLVDNLDEDGEGGYFKSVKTTVLIPILVKAIQELNAKVTALETQLGAK